MCKFIIPALGALALLAACQPAPEPSYVGAPAAPPPPQMSPISLQPSVSAAVAHHDAYVISIQRALAAKGYYHGQVDGDCGPATQSAVERYQHDLGVAVRGHCKVGDQEWSALSLAPGEKHERTLELR
jgi:peptidoglycan hydrolase-like protein with peptidoglycan-binding domain